MLAVVSTSAHQVPVEVRAYLRVDGSALHVFVRLPVAAALADARLPVSVRGIVDLETIRPMLDAAAADVVKSLDVLDARDAGGAGGGGRPLPAPSVAWVVSAPRDATFATYQTAVVRLAATSLPADTPINVTEGFLDLRLDYALASPTPRLSARFNGLRANGQFIPTRATYITADGDERPFDIAGAPRRVFFEPSSIDAARLFARLGVARLLSERELLLFLFCLAIPVWRTPAPLGAVGTLLAAVLTAAILVAIVPAPVPAASGIPLPLLSQLLASAALVVAALQSMTTPRPASVRMVCVVFGLAIGAGIGAAGREALSFGGSHGVACLTIYLGVMTSGLLVLVPIFRAFVAWFRRLPLPEQAVSVLLSLVPLHTAVHSVQNNGQLVNERASAAHGSGPLGVAIAHWPPVVAMIILVLLAMTALLLTASTAQAPDARVGDGR